MHTAYSYFNHLSSPYFSNEPSLFTNNSYRLLESTVNAQLKTVAPMVPESVHSQ